MKLGGKKIKKIFSKIGSFWFGNYGIFFVLFFIIVSLFSAYVLYDKIYASDWTEEERQEYIRSKQDVTVLKRGEFDRVVQGINRRHGYSERRFEPIDNIFEISGQ
jgi:hypothetical protein